MSALSPVPVTTPTSGNTSGTSIPVTLPSYTVGDFILLVVASNQAQATITFSASISSSSQIATAGNRVLAYLLVPNGAGQTSVTMTAGTSGVVQWWCADYGAASTSLPVSNGANAVGNSTSSAIAMPEVELGYITTGNELLISAAGVNSTATWTTDAGTQFHTTSGNAAMLVDAVNPAAGILTGVPVGTDRGSNGSSRNQNAIAFVLQATPGGTINLLSNPSFETGSPIATGWTDEHTTATQATYAIVGTGVVDGTVAQHFAYTGVLADGGNAKTEMYQAPITGVAPGNYLTFSSWVSGSLSNTYAFIGIEAFNSGGTYLSEADTNILTLGTAPVRYSVSYLCPAATDHVAVYIQCPGIGATSSLSVTMDKAELTIGTAPPAGGAACRTAPLASLLVAMGEIG